MPEKTRIASIDLLRGLVMLIMAIDHLRDLLHLGHPAPTNFETTTPVLFFSRWITHFCAPTFVFLSGISAFLAGKRRTKDEMAAFLVKRGIWLLFVELFIINFATSVDPLYHVIVLQVIWAIGGSMILLGLLVWANLSPGAIGGIGLTIFLGHNIIDLLHNKAIDTGLLWRLFLSGHGFNTLDPMGPDRFLLVAYALIPWTGVMLIGYSLGTLYTKDAARRKKTLTIIALSMLAFFILFRTFNIYGDPAHWSIQKDPVLTILSFLNVTKYPCSLLYLCMTLGVTILILAHTENAGNRFARILIVYGNVPFFYYVCHWFLAQAITIILFFSTGHHMNELNPDKTGFPFSPNNFGLPLGGVYIVWLLLITSLYFPCRWFGQYKKTHKQWWLSYL
ncbi:MAG TPA: heparan-alpha-glucosaminide N-acetyltransferase domain-containing protein [Puia sp.]|nr:heparan-alpha-glucosaminide N-acetyltransferase domain-containing protein [Puia sp.]